MDFKEFFLERYGGYAKSRDIYYHGTNVDNLRSILKQGLITNPKNKVWDFTDNKDDSEGITGRGMFKPTLMSIPNSIYVTTSLPFAISAATIGNASPLIVCMELSDRILNNDEDNLQNVLDSVVSVKEWDSENILKKKVQNYLIKSTNPESYFKDVKNFTYPIYEKFLKYKVDKRLIDNILSKIKIIYKTMLFRQAAYSSELSELLGIKSDKEQEMKYIKMMDWLTKQTKFFVRKNKNNNISSETARITENIGFSGKNKITCLFTLPEYHKFHGNMYTEKIVYGEMPEKTQNVLSGIQEKRKKNDFFKN